MPKHILRIDEAPLHAQRMEYRLRVQNILFSWRQVLALPRLPKAKTISERMRQLNAMDADAPRAALASYSAALDSWADADSLLSSSNVKKMLEGTPQEMRGELIKRFIKPPLGKPQLAAPTDAEH